MKEQLGSLIDLGGSLVLSIPKELVRFLKLNKDTKVVKNWNSDTQTFEVKFVEITMTDIFESNANSISPQFREWIEKEYLEGEE